MKHNYFGTLLSIPRGDLNGKLWSIAGLLYSFQIRNYPFPSHCWEFCASSYSSLCTACERQNGKRNYVLQVPAICLLDSPGQKQSKRGEQVIFTPPHLLKNSPHPYNVSGGLKARELTLHWFLFLCRKILSTNSSK